MQTAASSGKAMLQLELYRNHWTNLKLNCTHFDIFRNAVDKFKFDLHNFDIIVKKLVLSSAIVRKRLGKTQNYVVFYPSVYQLGANKYFLELKEPTLNRKRIDLNSISGILKIHQCTGV